MDRTSDGLPSRPLYLFDLPPEIVSALEPAPQDSAAELQDSETSTSRPTASSKLSGDGVASTSSTTSCALCSLTFSTVQDQRSHVRSDLHSYNLKQKLRGQPAVSEAAFEKLVEELDESLSGSDSSDSSSNSLSGDDNEQSTRIQSSRGTTNGESKLPALLKKQARLHDSPRETDNETDTQLNKSQKRGHSGAAPLLWLKSSALPRNASLGIYKVVFTESDLTATDKVIESIQTRQLSPKPKIKAATHKDADEDNDDGGVPLPASEIARSAPGPHDASTPHFFLCMIGGGHFAAMIVSLTPKIVKNHGVEERQASVLAHKTFHRYTTRRKQGGAQSANDASKGAAHSAGSSLRRYNEAALTSDIRALLAEWKPAIDSAELCFIRATNNTSRRTLFGPYEAQVLHANDPRIRKFPFSTRRPTQAELMRCFVELTRVKVSVINEEAARAAAQHREDVAKAAQQHREATELAAQQHREATAAAARKHEEEQTLALHTTQIEAFIRRGKAPALVSYLSSNKLSPNFELWPTKSQAHHHAPTALHLSSSVNAAPLVSALLTKAGADPTIENGDGKTAFELAGDRATRDAFRVARHELGESAWKWDDGCVPSPISKADSDARTAREREQAQREDNERKREGLERLREREREEKEAQKRAGNAKKDAQYGKGRLLNSGRERTAEERREEDARGMTPEMRAKMERERRARAAEERIKKMQAQNQS